MYVPGHDGGAFEALSDPTQPPVLLLRRVRDEAHRFAKLRHSQLREQRALSRDERSSGGVAQQPNFSTGELDEAAALARKVKGLGHGTAVALIEHIGSLTAVTQATDRELQAVPGVGPALASRIQAATSSVEA